MKPTDLNTWSLAQLFGAADEVSNAIPAPSVPHVRRCHKAGLVEVVGGRKGTLRLTDAGRAAVAKHRAANGNVAS